MCTQHWVMHLHGDNDEQITHLPKTNKIHKIPRLHCLNANQANDLLPYLLQDMWLLLIEEEHYCWCKVMLSKHICLGALNSELTSTSAGIFLCLFFCKVESNDKSWSYTEWNFEFIAFSQFSVRIIIEFICLANWTRRGMFATNIKHYLNHIAGLYIIEKIILFYTNNATPLNYCLLWCYILFIIEFLLPRSNARALC